MAAFKTFTTGKGVIQVRGNAEVWCEVVKDWIASDEEKYSQEMKLNKEKQLK